MFVTTHTHTHTHTHTNTRTRTRTHARTHTQVQLVEADQADKTVSGHRRAADGGATACELGVAGSSTASQVEPEVVAADRDTAAAGEGAEREDKSVSASEDRPKLDVMGVGVEAFPLGPVRNPVEEARRRMESAQNVGDAP
jgi:hypothetical protein